MAEEKRREEQEFSFVKEKIKKQPFYQNKTLRRAALQLIFSVVCGAVACFVFVIVHPWMERTFGEQEMTEITIPQEEEEETVTEPQEETEDEEPVVITEPRELEVEDYADLYTKLKEVADTAGKSLVTVTASSSGTDWFNETYESRRELSGLLVGNNGVELLILAPYSQVEGADTLQAAFADGSTLAAVLKNYDSVTDLAVLSVNLADVEEDTLESIRMAELGSSKSLKAGEPVIAVGSPAGIAGSVKYGNLVASGYKVSVIDGEYNLLITDMERSEKGSGVLLNLNGQVIGLLEDSYLNSSNEGALTAYAISDMKDIIEHLSNSQDLVYMGIHGTDVTEEISEAQGIPAGVYVTGMEADSPAMNSGIQAGDIITEINGKTITSLSQIREMLLKFSREQVIQVVVMRQGKDGYKEIECSVTLNVLQ
ncbi:MAG TPA: PDZ domain-containing protein [Candidatus Merdisoma faecalis]|nr:PDZ domain-containing protein [Candidatus Merdisoma faecalis]